jgi:hypothetical protein
MVLGLFDLVRGTLEQESTLLGLCNSGYKSCSPTGKCEPCPACPPCHICKYLITFQHEELGVACHATLAVLQAGTPPCSPFL